LIDVLGEFAFGRRRNELAEVNHGDVQRYCLAANVAGTFDLVIIQLAREIIRPFFPIAVGKYGDLAVGQSYLRVAGPEF